MEERLLVLLTFAFVANILQLPPSQCALSDVWNRVMTFSCEFAEDIERYLPKSRSRRHIIKDVPDFENPEAVFAYLYPLADVLKPTVGKFGTSTPKSQVPLITFYTWAVDLGHLLISDCNHRNDETLENDVRRLKMNLTSSSGSNRNMSSFQVPKYSRDILLSPKESLEIGNVNHKVLSQRQSISLRSIELSTSSRESNSFKSLSTNSRNTSGFMNLRSRRQSYDYYDGMRQAPPNNTTSTESPDTTTAASNTTDTTTTATTAAPNTFYTSYGGDIEYFFPLLSFGIPFDGEITFLGFHGFKGLFPY